MINKKYCRFCLEEVTKVQALYCSPRCRQADNQLRYLQRLKESFQAPSQVSNGQK